MNAPLAQTDVTTFTRLWPALTRGADDQDRTGMASLEGWGSTIELHPRVLGAVLGAVFITGFNTVFPIGKI